MFGLEWDGMDAVLDDDLNGILVNFCVCMPALPTIIEGVFECHMIMRERQMHKVMVRLLGIIFAAVYTGCVCSKIGSPPSGENEGAGLVLGLVLFGLPGVYM